MKTIEIYVNGLAYRFGKSTFSSDHGALLMIKDGKVINEWNTWREWDAIKASPDLLLAYKKLEIALKIEGI